MTCQLRIVMISHNTIPLAPHPRITPYSIMILWLSLMSCFWTKWGYCEGCVCGVYGVGILLLFSFQIAFLAAPGAPYSEVLTLPYNQSMPQRATVIKTTGKGMAIREKKRCIPASEQSVFSSQMADHSWGSLVNTHGLTPVVLCEILDKKYLGPRCSRFLVLFALANLYVVIGVICQGSMTHIIHAECVWRLFCILRSSYYCCAIRASRLCNRLSIVTGEGIGYLGPGNRTEVIIVDSYI